MPGTWYTEGEYPYDAKVEKHKTSMILDPITKKKIKAYFVPEVKSGVFKGGLRSMAGGGQHTHHDDDDLILRQGQLDNSRAKALREAAISGPLGSVMEPIEAGSLPKMEQHPDGEAEGDLNSHEIQTNFEPDIDENDPEQTLLKQLRKREMLQSGMPAKKLKKEACGTVVQWYYNSTMVQ